MNGIAECTATFPLKKDHAVSRQCSQMYIKRTRISGLGYNKSYILWILEKQQDIVFLKHIKHNRL